jgi:hypothetical protein
MAAVALHHALQYHWKDEDLRNSYFSAFDGQQLIDVLSLIDEETLTDQVDIGRYDGLHEPRGSQAARSRLRLLRQSRRVCDAPQFGVSGYSELVVMNNGVRVCGFFFLASLCISVPKLNRKV